MHIKCEMPLWTSVKYNNLETSTTLNNDSNRSRRCLAGEVPT